MLFLPCDTIKCCVLIDLENPKDITSFGFLHNPGNDVQKRGVHHFYEPLKGVRGKDLGITSCDLFAFKCTGGSNLDPEDVLFNIDGVELTFTEHVCPNYDLILAITDYSLTAPLTAMAKKYGFRGNSSRIK